MYLKLIKLKKFDINKYTKNCRVFNKNLNKFYNNNIKYQSVTF